MADNEYAIELVNICKNFGEVSANKNINLKLRKGEILALLGENGSGKTTLMNMLSGIYVPDSGSIFVNGEKVKISSPKDSKRCGIGMVHQHFKLVDRFTAAENIILGKNSRERFKDAFFVKKNCAKIINEKTHDFGFELDANKKVENMSVSEKQTLEILKVLYFGAKIIILDEPTAVLTVQEIEKLFKILRKMKESGHSIIIITHKLNEVMDISDRVAILRKGEYITTVNTKETNEKELTELMVGRKITLNISHPIIDHTRPLLEIRDLVVKGDEGNIAVEDMNFYIRGGEMLGVAGIAGSGQRELCEAIAGLREVETGKIIHKGENIVGLTPKEIINKGIAMSFIPEDRLGMGLASTMSIADNMILKKYAEGKGIFVDRKKGRIEAKQVIEDLKIVASSPDVPVGILSGGNVQKVLVGREIMAKPNVIVTAYPVRGLDINSSYAIYNILNREKEKGTGILFVGEDLDVMMELCDKIMVICHGKLMGVVHTHKTTKEEIGLMMTGVLDKTNKAGKIAGIAKDSNIVEDSNEEELVTK